MPFEIGNQAAVGGRKDKPFRDALLRAIKSKGPDDKALVMVAHSLLRQSQKGNVAAIKEVADRLDGKVPQGIIGDEGGPLVLQVIRYVVEPDQPIDVTPQTETLPSSHIIDNEITSKE